MVVFFMTTGFQHYMTKQVTAILANDASINFLFCCFRGSGIVFGVFWEGLMFSGLEGVVLFTSVCLLHTSVYTSICLTYTLST